MVAALCNIEYLVVSNSQSNQLQEGGYYRVTHLHGFWRIIKHVIYRTYQNSSTGTNARYQIGTYVIRFNECV